MTQPDGLVALLRDTGTVLREPPTELSVLLDDVVMFVRRFIVISDVQADAIALWTAHTHVYETARATPYLNFHSPEPGSGKTTGLEVIEPIVRNGLIADDLTGPSLFRLVDELRPSLLFDEIDGVFAKKGSDSEADLRKILNSGYKKGKKVYRCVGPSHKLTPFDVFCPKATAGLNELPGTLAHRSIPIAMKPPRPDEPYEEYDPEEAEAESEALRLRLEAWAEGVFDALSDPRLRPEKLPGLDARRNEIWRILFRIADLARGRWPEAARTAALELSGGERRDEEASAGVQLLSDIRTVFAEERLTCQALVDALNALEDSAWGGWNDGVGIKTRELGRKLGRYGIKAKPIRIDGERAGNGYERAMFGDSWARYLPAPPADNRYTGTSRPLPGSPALVEPVQTALVPVSANGANPHKQAVVPVVPVQLRSSGEAPA